MSTLPRIALALACLGVITACSSESPTAPASAASVLASSRANSTTEEPSTGPWSRIVQGKTGPGSLYALYVPTTWNGDLVTIAHGFRDAAAPVTIGTETYMGALRDSLGAQGYAVAWSSYSENGFAVKDGAQRTHQLRGLAAAQLGGQPNRTFLVGFSLGGAVALSIAEQFPEQYDGALLACGMVGGSLAQTQYLGHVRTLFDAAFPNVLNGTVLGVPTGYIVNPATVQAAVLQDLQIKLSQQKPPVLFTIASTRQTPLPYDPANAVPRLVESLITALSFHARGINNITDLVNGKSPFGNASDTYALGVPFGFPAPLLLPAIAALDTAAARVSIAPSAGEYLGRYYTPSGALGTKVLTLHNRCDPVVPVFHEDSLAAAVARAAATDNLVQRRRAQYGHCTFDAPTLMTAFGDLEQWSRTGTKPQ